MNAWALQGDSPPGEEAPNATVQVPEGHPSPCHPWHVAARLDRGISWTERRYRRVGGEQARHSTTEGSGSDDCT